MQVETLQPRSYDAYDAFVRGQPHGLIYHTNKYRGFLTALLGCQDSYLMATDGGEIRGVLPLMSTTGPSGEVLNSLPYYGSYGSVVGSDPAASELLLAAYADRACSTTTASATIIQNPFARCSAARVLHNYLDTRISQFTLLDVGPAPAREALLAHFHPSARRNIKKAERARIEVRVDNSELASLRRLHETNMTALGGRAKEPRFFELIAQHFLPSEDWNLYVARLDGAIIAALLVFYFNQTVEYYTPAIDERYRSLQPLALIVFTAMLDAIARGSRRWNWGGTWLDQTGVYQFKKKWAAGERVYHYYTQVNDASLLNQTASGILEQYPDFFVVPFSALRGKDTPG